MNSSFEIVSPWSTLFKECKRISRFFSQETFGASVFSHSAFSVAASFAFAFALPLALAFGVLDTFDTFDTWHQKCGSKSGFNSDALSHIPFLRLLWFSRFSAWTSVTSRVGAALFGLDQIGSETPSPIFLVKFGIWNLSSQQFNTGYIYTQHSQRGANRLDKRRRILAGEPHVEVHVHPCTYTKSENVFQTNLWIS